MSTDIVQIWMPGQPVNARVLLYRSCDEEQFLQNAQPHTKPDPKIFKVLPNGYPFLELLRVYCHFLENHDDGWVDSSGHNVPPQYIWLARNLSRLKFALQSWDDRSAAAAVKLLLDNRVALHPDQIRFIEFCKTFLEKVFRPVLWGSPVALNSTTAPAMARAWWAHPSVLSKETAVQIQDLKGMFAAPVPMAVQGSLLDWLGALKNWLDTKLLVHPPQGALREASAMCHALAKIHFSCGRYSLAVLLCHRSADLLLFSECAAAGLIDFTANNGGGEYRYPVNDRRTVGLMESYAALISHSIFLPNAQRKSRLENINRHRNHLLLTHYLGALSMIEAKTLLTHLTEELIAIGGQSWEIASKTVFQKIQIEERHFFELSDPLMSVLVPVPI